MAKAPKRDDTTTEPSIEAATNALEKAQADPAKLTNTDIKVASQDDGSDLPHNTANADAADAMAQDRDAAKGKEDDSDPGAQRRQYFGGQGGAAGL